MSRGGSGAGKTATAKRVPPPAVPGDAFGTPQHRHSGSSFGSQGYASCEDQPYPQPPDTPSHTRGKKGNLPIIKANAVSFLGLVQGTITSPGQTGNSVSSQTNVSGLSGMTPDFFIIWF